MRRACRSLVLALLFLVGPLGPPPARADAIDDYIRTEMSKRRIPGLALAVFKDGVVVKI